MIIKLSLLAGIWLGAQPHRAVLQDGEGLCVPLHVAKLPISSKAYYIPDPRASW